MDQPSHQTILDTLHEHDRRLVKVETELHGLHTEVKGLADRFDRIVEHVAELRGTQKMVFWILATGVPLISGLQVWGLFRG